MINAQQAYGYGLVNKVVSLEELGNSAMEWAMKLAEKPPVAMQSAKIAMNTGSNVDLESALEIESARSSIAFTSEDRKEGMAAFAEKRKPNFAGR